MLIGQSRKTLDLAYIIYSKSSPYANLINFLQNINPINPTVTGGQVCAVPSLAHLKVLNYC